MSDKKDMSKVKPMQEGETVAEGIVTSQAGLALAETNFSILKENEEGREVVKRHSIVPFMPSVIIEPLNSNFIMPTYAHDGDSGMDVYSTIDTTICPEHTLVIPLGFKIEVPEHPMSAMGYRWEIQVRSRSGLSLTTLLRVEPSTIDNGYRGEVGIILHNTASPSYKLAVGSKANTIIIVDIKSDYVSMIDNTRILFEVHTEDQGNVISPQPDGTYLIRKGDKIAQLVFNEVIRPLQIVKGTVSKNTDRGEGAYASSGLRAKTPSKKDITPRAKPKTKRALKVVD